MAVELYSATVTSGEGLKANCKVREFEILMDEPEALGGTNAAMNPIEGLLSSIGGCKVIVAKCFAKMNKIKLESIEIKVEGDLDPDGFMGKNPNAKVGLTRIKSIYIIKADNTEEEIKNFVSFIERTCPVIDTIVNSPVTEEEIVISD